MNAQSPIRPTLTRQLLRMGTGATGVLAFTTVGMVLVRIVSTVTLTRLLAPDVFGLVGIISSVFFTVGLLTDLGFQAYLVRHPLAEDRRFRDVIWTIHATRGAGLFLLCAIGAPVVAWLLGKPEVASPLAVASLTLLFSGFNSMSLILTLRHGGARRLSVFDFAMNVVQTLLSIALAVWLRNVWAFVFSMVAQSVLKTLLSYTMFPNAPQRFARDRDWAREFFAFSRVVMASSFLTLLISQVDKLVLARLFTLDQFGLYAIALSLVSVPVGFVSNYVTRVTYPIYVRTWHDDPARLAAVYYAARRRVSLLYALGSGALIGGAPLAIAILYDPRYLPASAYVAWLAVGSAVRMSVFSAAEVMTAIGKIRMTLKANAVRVVWLCVALPIGFWRFGSIGLVAAVGLVELPVLVYSWFVLGRERLLDMREELLQLVLAAAAGGAAYAVSVMGLRLFPGL